MMSKDKNKHEKLTHPTAAAAADDPHVRIDSLMHTPIYTYTHTHTEDPDSANT